METNELERSTLENVVQQLISASYPLKTSSVRLAKVMSINHEEMFEQKGKRQLSQSELQGDNYLFWCFITLTKPTAKKKQHTFEEKRTPYRFLFGHMTIFNGMILCDIQEIDFFYWARIARYRGWFDYKDVRTVEISYFHDEFGKLTSRLLLERNDAGK